MAREYFAAYHSYLKSVEKLNDAECGRLFKACLEYSISGVDPELRGNERFIWPTMREQIDRDKQRYDELCETNRKNVERRYTTVNDGIRPPTKSTKTKAKEKTKEISPAEIPQGLSEAWERFVEHRKKLKAPMNNTAQMLIVNELNRLAPGDLSKQIEIIDRSIMQGWRGVFSLDGKAKSKPIQREFNQHDQTDDQLAHLLVDLDGEIDHAR